MIKGTIFLPGVIGTKSCRRFLLLLLVVITVISIQTLLSGQTQLFHHKFYNKKDGLSNSHVLSLCQDDNGIVWIGTKYGLNRYDGHRFKLFTRGENGLTSNIINRIIKAPSGNLWLIRLQESHGNYEFFSIDVFDPVWETSRPLDKVFPDFPQSVEQLEKIIEVEGGMLISFRNKESYLFDKNSQLHRILLQDGYELKYKTSPDRYLCYKNDQYLFVDRQGKEKGALRVQPGITLSNFIVNKEGRVWCIESSPKANGHGYSIQYFSEVKSNGSLERSQKLSGNLYDINLLKNEEKGMLYLIENNRIQQFDFATNLQSLKTLPFPDFLVEMPRAAMIDANGDLWLGDFSGLQTIHLASSQFKTYMSREKSPFPVRGIMQIQEKLAVNSPKGAILIDKTTSQKTTYLDQPAMGTLKPFSTLKTEGGNIYMVTEQLLEVDSAFKIKRKTNITPKKRDRIWSFCKDGEHRFWLGRALEDIYIVEEEDFSKVDLFEKYNGFEDLKSTFKWQFFEDGDFIWISAQNGLYLIHKEKGVISRFGANEEAPFYLPAIIFHYVFKDKNESYWLATGDGGLIRLEIDPNNPEKNTFRQFTKADGFPSLELYAIMEDEKGWFWISSANGLIRFQPQRVDLQVFTTEEGIADNEFNKLAYFKNEEGTIYFGGVNGLTEIDPKLFSNNKQYDFQLVLSGAKVLSSKKDTFKNVFPLWNQEQTIVLKPGDVFLTLEFSLQDYCYSNKSSYSYRLKDHTDNWTSLQNNILQLAGLPYGKHTLEVRARGRLNQFTNENLLIPIEVVRPVYLQTWFLVLLALLVGLSLWQYNVWRIRSIKKREETLELIVRQRTQKIREDKKLIEHQAAQLKELDELKSRFFQNVSHELRTPLTLILGPLDKVLGRNKLENQDFTLLKIMKENVKHLHKRINELLDLSSLDAVSMEMHPVPVQLYTFLKRTLSQFESSASVKNIRLEFNFHPDQDLTLLLDKEKMEKILFNLLSNAIKFTPENGTVAVKCRQSEGKVQLQVKDTGIGIPQEEQEKIFDRFFQASRDQYFEGTGIGLSLCKELAELMEGAIKVTSEPGKGSTFTLTIPAIETMEAPHVKDRSEFEDADVSIEKEALQTGDPILVVEDNASLRNYLKLVLEKYNVKLAGHGKEALEILENGFSPVAIITDIMMPVMDGVALLEKIRQHNRYRNIPVIMLTAVNSSTQKVEALRIGVDDYLTKPFNEEELKASLQAIIANSKNRMADNRVQAATETPGLTEGDLAWLQEVEEIIFKNIGNPLFGIEQLADQLQISTRRLQQKIKAISGMTPKAYQREVQLEKARRILVSGACKSVSELSGIVGFSDAHYFSNLYEKRFGKKPKDYL